MKKNIFVMLCLSIAQAAFAQMSDINITYNEMRSVPSSMQFQRDNLHLSFYSINLTKDATMFISAALPKYLEKHKQEIVPMIQSFAADFKKLKPSLDENTYAHKATYLRRNDDKYQIDLTINEKAKQSYLVSKETDSPMALKIAQDTLVLTFGTLNYTRFYESNLIELPVVTVYVLANNLADIEQIVQNVNIEQKINNSLDKVKKYTNDNKRFTYYSDRTFYLSPSIDSITAKKIMNRLSPKYLYMRNYSPRSPYILPNTNFGIIMIGNQFNLSLHTGASFIPSRRHTVGYTLGVEQIYSSDAAKDGGFRTTINQFLYGGINLYDEPYKMLKQTNDRLLVGIYYGYLIDRRNDLFNKGTMMLMGTFGIKNTIRLTGGVYFDGFFKNAVPSLKLSLGI